MTSYYYDDLTVLGEMDAVARQLWATSGLSPDDIQTAVIYDHFTPYVLYQLEELGFCAKGEAKDFVRDGNIEIGGGLPDQHPRGQLGEAYLHGMNGIAEGVRQVRGDSYNQVTDVEHVLVTAGTGVPTSGLDPGHRPRLIGGRRPPTVVRWRGGSGSRGAPSCNRGCVDGSGLPLASLPILSSASTRPTGAGAERQVSGMTMAPLSQLAGSLFQGRGPLRRDPSHSGGQPYSSASPGHSAVLRADFVGIGASSSVIVLGWFAALFTGRLPEPIAKFLPGYLRWVATGVHVRLPLVDAYPPFSLDPGSDLPRGRRGHHGASQSSRGPLPVHPGHPGPTPLRAHLDRDGGLRPRHLDRHPREREDA